MEIDQATNDLLRAYSSVQKVELLKLQSRNGARIILIRSGGTVLGTAPSEVFVLILDWSVHNIGALSIFETQGEIRKIGK